jgi:hypothetical protein
MSDTIDRPLDTDPLAEEFFSQPPPPTETPSEHWEARPMSASQRRAMRATLAMLLGVAVVTVCFAAYAEIAMVKPAPLGSAGLPRVAAAAPLEPEHSQPLERPFAAEQQQVAEPQPPSAGQEQPPSHEQQPAAEPQALEPSAPAAEAIATERAAPTASTPSSATPLAATLPSAARAAMPGASEMLVKRSSAHESVRAESSPAVDALTKRAYGELKHGRPQEAIEAAAHAIRLDPTRASAYIALGGARDAIGDHQGARAVFRDCVQRANDKLTDACRTLAR